MTSACSTCEGETLIGEMANYLDGHVKEKAVFGVDERVTGQRRTAPRGTGPLTPGRGEQGRDRVPEQAMELEEIAAV